jgi:hypothetical protein
MIVIYSRNQVPIRLTQKRWEHILRRHPEMANQKDRVLETLSDPDLIQQGDLGTLLAIRLYAQSPLTRKHLVVVYKELNGTDGFVLTAYSPLCHPKGGRSYGSAQNLRGQASARLGIR